MGQGDQERLWILDAHGDALSAPAQRRPHLDRLRELEHDRLPRLADEPDDAPAEAHPDPGEPRPVHRRRAADQTQRDIRPSQDAETDLHLGLAEIDEPPVRGEQRQEGKRPP